MRRGLLRLGLSAAFIGLLSVGVSLVPNLLSRLEVFQIDGVRIDGPIVPPHLPLACVGVGLGR